MPDWLSPISIPLLYSTDKIDISTAGGQRIWQFRVQEDNVGSFLIVSNKIIGAVSKLTIPCEDIATTLDLRHSIQDNRYTNSGYFRGQLGVVACPEASEECLSKPTLSED